MGENLYTSDKKLNFSGENTGSIDFKIMILGRPEGGISG